MMSEDVYADDFEALYAYCLTHNVAMQTIKSVARRHWADEDDEPKFAWYMTLKDVDPIRRAVHYVLTRAGLFLNTPSDATILRHTLDAANPLKCRASKRWNKTSRATAWHRSSCAARRTKFANASNRCLRDAPVT